VISPTLTTIRDAHLGDAMLQQRLRVPLEDTPMAGGSGTQHGLFIAPRRTPAHHSAKDDLCQFLHVIYIIAAYRASPGRTHGCGMATRTC
jgi:hypothetical protein